MNSEEKIPKLLLAGPWQGEFGWELMRWQGHLRYLKHENNFDKVIVSIQKEHKFLYSDFADEYLFCPRGKHTDGLKNYNKMPCFDPNIVKAVKINHKGWNLRILSPCYSMEGNDYDKRFLQKFISYGKQLPKKHCFDLLIHARTTKKTKSHVRNWSIRKWAEVTHYFKNKLNMASIGISEQSEHIAYTKNLLNLNLDDLVNVMYSSKLVAGPSSGPMHLASLCKCPHLIWTNKKVWKSVGGNNRYRYEYAWNPFKTPVIVLDDCNWQPQVSEVIKAIKNYFKM